MHKLLTTLLACAAFPSIVPAQTTSWARTYEGGGEQGAADVRQTPDGGFLVSGWRRNLGAGYNSDMWLVRLDPSGNIVFQRSLAGPNREEMNRLEQTSDGGFIGIGLSASFGASQHAPLVVKMDASGNIQWQKTYLGSGRDWGAAIKETSDGGYIIAGGTDPSGQGTSLAVVKIDAAGNIQWQNRHGQNCPNGFDVVPAPDGSGYLVLGLSCSGAGGEDAWLLKLDLGGNILWQKTYGGSGTDVAFSLQAVSDGGWILAGETSTFGAGGLDGWILKLDGAGNVAWQKSYGGPGAEAFYHIEQTGDGGYIAGGYTTTFASAYQDLWVLKLDASGNVVWQRSYDSGAPEDIAFSVRPTADGGFVVAGYSDPGCPLCNPSTNPDKFTVMKLAADGSVASNCPEGVGRATTATVQNTNAVVLNASGAAAALGFRAIDTNVVVTNTNAAVETLCERVVMEVALDIKPGSCPNPMNLGDRGALPVAITGTADLDVSRIDVSSLRLEGVAPLRTSFEDVAGPFTPMTGKRDCLRDCTTAGPDGRLDLTARFDFQRIVSAMGPAAGGQCRVLVLTGKLKPEFGGTPIRGEDVVSIR